MSARDLIAPNRALGATLNDISRRVERLRRRATWSGALSVARTDIDASISYTTSFVGATADDAPFASIVLPPGRWLIHGQIWQEATGVGSDVLTVFTVLTATGASVVQEQAATTHQGDVETTDVATLRIAEQVDTTVELVGEIGLLGTFSGTWYVNYAQITAIPG